MDVEVFQLFKMQVPEEKPQVLFYHFNYRTANQQNIM